MVDRSRAASCPRSASRAARLFGVRSTMPLITAFNMRAAFCALLLSACSPTFSTAQFMPQVGTFSLLPVSYAGYARSCRQREGVQEGHHFPLAPLAELSWRVGRKPGLLSLFLVCSHNVPPDDCTLNPAKWPFLCGLRAPFTQPGLKGRISIASLVLVCSTVLVRPSSERLCVRTRAVGALSRPIVQNPFGKRSGASQDPHPHAHFKQPPRA